MTSSFTDQVLAEAAGYSRPKDQADMTAPVAVAGLADTVKSAVAAMARAKSAADSLGSSAKRLIDNLANVDGIKTQLDTANSQLEEAVQAVGGPLGDGSVGESTSAPSAQAPASQPAASGASTTPAEGIRQSTVQVQAANQQAANAQR